MHELSIARNILDIIEETSSGNKAGEVKTNFKRLHEVRVQIGEMVAVVPESLQFYYDSLIENTPYANSKLVIELLPVKARCKNCKTQFDPEEIFFICPQCQSHDIEVIQGNELKIVSLDVD